MYRQWKPHGRDPEESVKQLVFRCLVGKQSSTQHIKYPWQAIWEEERPLVESFNNFIGLHSTLM